MMWLKNAGKNDSATLTFAVIAFIVCIFKFLAGGSSTTIKGHDVNFGQSDAASIAALLTPTLGAYVARRHSEAKYGGGSPGPDPDDADVPPPAHDPKG